MDCAQRAERRRVFLAGVRDGVPIGLGYLAVAFSLGIAARNAGLNAFQGFLISLLNNASAGEYAAFTVIAADSGFLEMALITLITNARYLLMSCSLSQKFSPDTPLYHRLLVGYDVTDELFGIAIARPGYLDPFYSYGAFLPAIPGWAIGTALGVTAGSILPARLVSALSVALFGMFLAIIIPPSKKNPVVLGCVAVSFAASWLCTVLPYVKTLSEGTRTILLTILIASAAALLFPVKDAPEQKEEVRMNGKIYLYILVCAAVSFLIRELPLTLIRRPIKSRFLRSFLFYVPYVTLAVMTFPSIVNATSSPIAGLAALVLGIAAAWLGANLLQVAVGCCAVVLVLEFFLI